MFIGHVYQTTRVTKDNTNLSCVISRHTISFSFLFFVEYNDIMIIEKKKKKHLSYRFTSQSTKLAPENVPKTFYLFILFLKKRTE